MCIFVMLTFYFFYEHFLSYKYSVKTHGIKGFPGFLLLFSTGEKSDN